MSLFLEGLPWFCYQNTGGQVDTHSNWLSGLPLAQLKVVDDNLQSQKSNLGKHCCDMNHTKSDIVAIMIYNLSIEL